MELLKQILDLFLHIDKNLVSLVQNYGSIIYGLLFIVLFMETGLVIMPFLPGDSLLFAAGALAALGSFNIFWLYGLLFLAAFLGDTINYWIGHFVGPKAFSGKLVIKIYKLKIDLSRFFKEEYLEEAQNFYKKYGGKAIVLARFVPIVRTFAPFVAGVGKMHYGNFIRYNILGAFLWVTLFTFGGYFLGNLPFVKENFHYMVLLIIFVSVLPIVWEIIKNKKK